MPRSKHSDFPPPSLITTTDELDALCTRLAAEEFVTVDTEFMRERTYWPELCVVQLAGDNEVAVVDTEAEGIDLAPLGRLLADQKVLKVFHACRQDIEIFVLKFGDVPRSKDGPRPSPALVSLLKVLLAAKCEQHHVAPKLVASSEDIDRLAVEDAPDIQGLQGWRREVFGNDAMALKSGRIAVGVDGKRIKLIPAA